MSDIARARQCHPSLAPLGTNYQLGHVRFETKDVYTLDVIPYLHLENFIRSLQSSLVTGKSVKIFLTTRSPSVSFWNSSFILTAISFLPRATRFKGTGIQTAVQPESQILWQLPRCTTTPLQASLSQVIGTLTSGRSPFLVDSVQNISEEYASALNKYAEELEEDANTRNAFLDLYGLNGWREERLWAWWKAGLLNADLLQEWSIIVRK